MNKIREISAKLTANAADVAKNRQDPRGQQLNRKFTDYAANKTNKSPDIFLQSYESGIKRDRPIKISIVNVTPTSGGIYSVSAISESGGRFNLYIDTKKIPFIIMNTSNPHPNSYLTIDRAGAVKLSKLIPGSRPTDFPLSEKPSNQQTTEHFMKENLQVREFSLKQIVENLDKIPRDGGAKFGHEQQKLTPQQKKDLMEKVRKFNEYGKVLRCETALMEMSKTLAEIGQMAESYIMEDSGEYFQGETIKRDFKEVKGITKQFSQLARECFGGLQQLNALYEDMGRKMERYFEIQSLEEIANAMDVENPSKPAPVVGEVADDSEEPLNENVARPTSREEIYRQVGARAAQSEKSGDRATYNKMMAWYNKSVPEEKQISMLNAIKAFSDGVNSVNGPGK